MYRGGLKGVVDTRASNSYIFRLLTKWGGGFHKTLYISAFLTFS